MPIAEFHFLKSTLRQSPYDCLQSIKIPPGDVFHGFLPPIEVFHWQYYVLPKQKYKFLNVTVYSYMTYSKKSFQILFECLQAPYCPRVFLYINIFCGILFHIEVSQLYHSL